MPILTAPASGHAVVINDEGKVLLLQNIVLDKKTGKLVVTDRYVFTGGRVEEGEEPVPALLREIKEETGLTNVRVILPIHICLWEPTHIRLSVIYLVRAYGNEKIVLQKEEAASYKWVSFDEAMRAPLWNAEHYNALRKAKKIIAIREIEELDALRD
jgi:8-oxo-dGTP pyrophosphatase MutT (NUDIX family)